MTVEASAGDQSLSCSHHTDSVSDQNNEPYTSCAAYGRDSPGLVSIKAKVPNVPENQASSTLSCISRVDLVGVLTLAVAACANNPGLLLSLSRHTACSSHASESERARQSYAHPCQGKVHQQNSNESPRTRQEARGHRKRVVCKRHEPSRRVGLHLGQQRRSHADFSNYAQPESPQRRRSPATLWWMSGASNTSRCLHVCCTIPQHWLGALSGATEAV